MLVGCSNGVAGRWPGFVDKNQPESLAIECHPNDMRVFEKDTNREETRNHLRRPGQNRQHTQQDCQAETLPDQFENPQRNHGGDDT